MAPSSSSAARSASSRVLVYGTPYCGYCSAARSLLEARGQAYDWIDVSREPALRLWLRQETGQRTVPQIFIDGRSIGGYSELAALQRSGELSRLLG